MIKFITQNIWRQLPSFLHQTEISESIKLCQLGFRNTMFHTDLENRSEITETENKAKRKLSESSGKENSSNEKKNVVLQFAKLSEHAFAPVRGSAYAAGYDLFSAYDCMVPAHGKALAKTDIQIALPDGCYGRVAPRSGLAAKHFIDVGAGVIDQDYRGNVGVLLFNFGEEDFKVNKGDRIAQLILERIYLPDLEELPKLDETVRGSGGFGSTGSR